MNDDATAAAGAALRFPMPTPPAPAQMTEVAEGLFWVRMPMPLALDHINLWLIADGDSWTLVDTGLGWNETCDLWQRLLAGPAGRRPLARLICTHYHPDHFGLSGWLARTYGAQVLMTETEWIVGTLLQRLDDVAFTAGQDAFFAEHGLPDEDRAWFRKVGNNYRKRVLPSPSRFTRIRDGDEIVIGGRPWRVIVARGHAAELACLYCAELKVLISADQVLPTITPNISVHWFKGGSRPLADYLESLDGLERLPADTLVLPSHKLPFYGLRPRIAGLRDHHRDRLQALEAALADGAPRTAAELLPALFSARLLERRREDQDRHHIMFAIGEAVAHLSHLVDAGRVAQHRATDGAVSYTSQTIQR